MFSPTDQVLAGAGLTFCLRSFILSKGAGEISILESNNPDCSFAVVNSLTLKVSFKVSLFL